MRWGSAVMWHITAKHSWQHGTVLMEYTQMRVRMFISHNFGVLADKYGEGAKTFKHRWTQEWIQGQVTGTGEQSQTFSRSGPQLFVLDVEDSPQGPHP